MVNPVWLVPVAAVLVGGAAVAALVRSAAEEARVLVEELRRQESLTSALRRLAGALSDLGGSLPRR